MKNPPNIRQPMALSLPPEPATMPKNLLEILYVRLKTGYLRRRNRRILLALSDDQLKDIGLSRSEIFSNDRHR